MRILMTTSCTTLLDGINRHILTIAKALKEMKGVEVAVCTLFPRGELNEALEREGIDTYSLDAKNGHQLKILWRFSAIIRKTTPDIIHFHVIAAMERFVMSWIFHNVPCVITYHGIGGASGWLEKLLSYITPLNIKCYLSVSKGVEKYYKKRDVKGDGRIWRVVYNPVKCSERITNNKLCNELGVPKDSIIIGTACRIADIKNPLAFTKLMAKMLQRNNEIHAVILGDGDADIMNQMRMYVMTTDVGERFHFLGYRKDSSALISGFKFFIMTSYREGLPTAMLEAMSSGVPVAFWEGGGGLSDLKEINKSCQFGVSRPVGDIDNLVTDVERVLAESNKWSELSSNARLLVKRMFSVETITDQLYEVYRQAVSHKPSDTYCGAVFIS